LEFLMHVNGQPYHVNADPKMPLLWVLRDVLNLTGTKYGCGIGFCGACTVHLDGTPIRSCQKHVADVGAAQIITIEGLGAHDLHPIQRAWISEQVPQCGYCQSGQIMSAAALLKTHPVPTDAQIEQAMSGNLCRCAVYPRIRRAIRRAAQEHSA
jgi:isoquinoline 1-oxidoreductase alpha subunit